ncbi:MAG: alpha/beta hydrolase [Aphanocapsa feldmannii 277cV]|uniref:Alpha/beta hydrolase n=1 Tax=Aphanocapsa feldmannii 277cV TaxID=2507553 RepID=A0A524RPQ3_9CHRO|nr:MAG: alpha/beta hydrolase [Aphanocapsa feldmannii 277cV]
MTTTPLQLLAMHGWAGWPNSFSAWQEPLATRGWTLHCGNRGYGLQAPTMPDWSPRGRRVLLLHSMGPHLLDPARYRAAEAVVLMASFGRFVPEGVDGQPVRKAIETMAGLLAAEEDETLFTAFREAVAAPQPLEMLPPGVESAGLNRQGRQRLSEDLALLERLEALPAAFPRQVPVLLVQPQDDAVVHPLAQRSLWEALPQAELLAIAGCGHGLLSAMLIPAVCDWLESQWP